jgi:4-amino-4-deoxy-L-arabinose transferase-like glycosyltransferase
MQKTTLWILVGLVVIGGFLRFYRLNQTLQFLGDQGRDALIVRRLLIEHDPVFIGPVTSVGNMYLGPGYYYFMLPFLALTYPSPMGPVYAVALLGTLTIFLIYKLGKEMVGELAALFAATIYTFSWVFIIQSRFSWNPNPAPLVSVIMIWATYRAWTKNSIYWIVVSFCFSLLMQLHYMALLALPSAGLIWFVNGYQHWQKDTKKFKQFLLHTVLAIGLFAISLTPLILFDIKHEFLNARAFYNIIAGKEDQVRGQTQIFRTLQETLGKSSHILFETTTNDMGRVNLALVITTIVFLIIALLQKDKYTKGQIVIAVWLAIGVIGTSLYKSTVFDHYIAYLFPVTSVVIAIVLSFFWHHRVLRVLVPTFFIWFFATNLIKYDYGAMSWTVQDIENYSKQILQHIEAGEPYSLVGINSYNDIYAMNYRYYLTAWGKPPLETEDANSARKLLIVNENYLPLNEVLDSPIYEIVIFPQKEEHEVLTFQDQPDLIILRR